MAKSFLNIAYELVVEKGTSATFNEIWSHIVEESGIDEETAKAKIAQFYTNLTLDGRFVNLGDNVWDLRERHTFEESHIDMKAAYSDTEDVNISGVYESDAEDEDYTEEENDDDEGEKPHDLEADE